MRGVLTPFTPHLKLILAIINLGNFEKQIYRYIGGVYLVVVSFFGGGTYRAQNPKSRGKGVNSGVSLVPRSVASVVRDAMANS